MDVENDLHVGRKEGEPKLLKYDAKNRPIDVYNGLILYDGKNVDSRSILYNHIVL